VKRATKAAVGKISRYGRGLSRFWGARELIRFS
jgi:hypothetical protein